MTLGVAGSSSIKENMVADKIDKDQFSSKLLTKQEAIKLQTDKWIEEYLVLCKSESRK